MRTRAIVLLVLATASSGACDRRGVVGVTSSRTVEGGAAGADAGTPGADAGAPGSDAGAPGSDVIDDCLPTNPANLDPSAVQALVDATGDASSLHLLYPYAGTVYPQGIPGPGLMWDGSTADVVYVRLRSSTFDYRGCLRPSGPNRLELPSGVWDRAAASTRGAADPFTLELKVLADGSVRGPISQEFVIAAGALQGSIYYMTTTSPAVVGGILRVRGGRPAEPVLTPSSCAGCHSVAANGTRLLAYSSGSGSSFTVYSGSAISPLVPNTPAAEFPAVYPDGSVYVASAHPIGAGPRSYGGGVANAGLYDTATGTLINDSGVPPGAAMPAFSPDGLQLAFTDFGASSGHTIALMDFSLGERAASAYRTLLSEPNQFLGWPAFLPDGHAVVFTRGSAPDFSAQNGGLIPFVRGAPTDLFIVDTSTQKATLLARAMGFDEGDAARTYLPGGETDLHQNYYPTVSPVATGGYAWVLFDSIRTYGNLGTHRAVWGAGIVVSPDGTYDGDPSHPAFYLPGQDINTPNFRAVAVLDP